MVCLYAAKKLKEIVIYKETPVNKTKTISYLTTFFSLTVIVQYPPPLPSASSAKGARHECAAKKEAHG